MWKYLWPFPLIYVVVAVVYIGYAICYYTYQLIKVYISLFAYFT